MRLEKLCHWNLAVLTLALLLPTTFTGCNTSESKKSADNEVSDDTDEASDLVGEVTIDGSSTVQPLTTAAAEAFIKIHKGVNVPVATSGTGGGFKKFVKGETDISNASRPITAEEFAQCKQNGVEFIEVPVAYDGLTIVVNPQNDFVTELTVDQIRKIYVDENPAKTWKDVNPDWPDEAIKVFSPGTDSGTFDYFREVLGGKKVAIRGDMQTSEDDNVLVQGVEGDKGAIGYFGSAYYDEAGGKLKAVSIVNPATGKATAANRENVISGAYAPYSRPLFVYVNAKSFERPEVRMFVEHYIENADEYATKVGYFPIPAAALELTKSHVSEGKLGTCFVTSDGQTREGAFIDNYKTENLVTTK